MSSLSQLITSFLSKKYTKSLLLISGLVFVSVCFGQETSGTQYTESELTKNIIEIFDLLFGLLALILGPMVILAGWLLSPDWTMGDFFGLRGYFKEVWILVANIVYIIFALMLLYMAIMQIFGGAESEYAFKKKLPSFLVGILIVPFTWLIVSWTLSFANQAVAAVLSIPMGSIGKLNTGGNIGEQSKSAWHKKVLPTQFDFTTNSSGYGNMTCENGYLKDDTSVRCISPAEFLTKNQAGPFFIIMIYAYNIFKIQEVDIQRITESNFCRGTGDNAAQYKAAKDCVENLMDLVRNFGLGLIVTIFFAIMLIALCWILLMRAIKLWIYIMLSPLFGLAYFTGKGFGESVGEAGESGFGEVGFKSFFKLAMVPVLVSAVLAFGLLFVGVVRDNFHGGLKNTNQTEFCTDQNAGYMVTYCITEITSGTEKIYESKLIIGTDTDTFDGEDSRIYLNFGDTFNKIIGTSAVNSAVAGGIDGGISSVNDIFAHIILTMLALIFMFMGVKMAAQYDPVTEAAFKPFAELGKATGNFIAHAPSYLPLPHPAFAAITNPAFASQAARMINKNVLDRETNMGKGLQDILGGQSGDFRKAAQDVASGATNLEGAVRSFERLQNKDPKEARKLILDAFQHASEQTKSNPAVQALMRDLEDDSSGRRITNILESHEAAVEALEQDSKIRGVRRIGTILGAQIEAAGQPFNNATISNGNIALGSRNVVSRDSAGNYTVGNLEPQERSHINNVLPRGLTIPNDQAGIEKLFKTTFPSLNLDDTQLPWAEKRKILEKMKDQGGH